MTIDDGLPYVDEHSITIAAPRDRVWTALRRHVDASLGVAAGSPLARVLGTEPRAGFEVSSAVPSSRLDLTGRHRFSRYRLVFDLADTADAQTLLTARTYATFPGPHGRLYRALVIGTRGHVVMTNAILRSVCRASLARRASSWDDSLQAFTDAADWFVQTVARVGDGWDRPGLGAWDVRALVGHTSRSLLTVETYLARPAAAVEITSAADYFRATKALLAGPDVAQRGREAGAALGDDPAAAVAEIRKRVLRLVAVQDGTELVTTIAGGMRLADYLPTRTFELAVHSADLAVAVGAPPEVPATAAAQALQLVSELAVAGDSAGQLLLAATGRPGLPEGFSVL